jgi:signal transduction histidine kinase
LVIGRVFYNLKRDRTIAILCSKAKSHFMHKGAYEFRNPLNGIIGFSEMLNSGMFGQLNDKQKERVHDIHLCGLHIQQIVRDLLDLEKGRSGALELIKSKVKVQRLIDKVVAELQHKVDLNGVRILQDIATPEQIIYCDQSKIMQALRHVLDNAIKFSPNGGQVTLTQILRRGGQYVEFVISDSGIGMTPYEQDMALCFPDDVEKVEHFAGLGIGGPIAKLFIELHNGRMLLESEEGLGTTVYITLPVESKTLIED